MRIAAFGFRSVPLRPGCAGADKFASELLPRLVRNGHEVVGYNRLYPGEAPLDDIVDGVRYKHFRTISRKGFDTLLHSAKCTWDIITRNTAEVVHIQNGGNSIFGLVLRMFGKRVFISQDGVDWKRDKWPWYGKLFLRLSSHLTAVAATQVIFDNVFVKKLFEDKFDRRYEFIPFGSEVSETDLDYSILDELGVEPGEYFLFVGRFIPDKGLQYLVPAFERLNSGKKLVLVGGSPNPSDFEKGIKATQDKRIVFPGFVYGKRAHALMKAAYCYIQPSDVEGLSPVILENMALGTPILCSDIVENRYVVAECALQFRKSDIEDCLRALNDAVSDPVALKQLGEQGRKRANETFSWTAVTTAHEKVFVGEPSGFAEC